MGVSYKSRRDLVTVAIWVDTRGNDLRVLTDKEVAVLPSPVPDGIFKEESKWLRPSWKLNNMMAMNSYREAVPGAAPVLDTARFVNAKIQVLLKEWTLGERDPALKLVFTEGGSKDTSVLSKETMENIVEMDNNLLTAIYELAMRAISPSDKYPNA